MSEGGRKRDDGVLVASKREVGEEGREGCNRLAIVIWNGEVGEGGR